MPEKLKFALLAHLKILMKNTFFENYFEYEKEEDIHNYYYIMMSIIINSLKTTDLPKNERLFINNELGLKITDKKKDGCNFIYFYL